jgi:uncharacterized repeat protein (TIGR01451 family)
LDKGSRLRWTILAALLCLAAGSAWAEINSVTGGIAGIDNGTLTNGDGTADARIELSGLTLALVKQTRDLSGVVLPAGSDVSAGQEIYFVLFVDNTTGFPANDVRITDLLDEAQFTYVADSLEQTTVASGASDAAIWAGVWASQSDPAADDDASAIDTAPPVGADRVTIGAVPAQTNQTVDIAGPSLRAFRFRVTVN